MATSGSGDTKDNGSPKPEGVPYSTPPSPGMDAPPASQAVPSGQGGGVEPPIPPDPPTPVDPPAPVDPRDVVDSNSPDNERVDWTKIPQRDTEPKAPQIGSDYDPRPEEDQARRHIAFLLIGLLWLVVAAIFVLIAFGTIQVIDIKEFAAVLGPVVTLVSAATGFYYGTKSK